MTTRQRRFTEAEIATIENTRMLTPEQTAELARQAPERIWQILLAHGDINEDGEWISPTRPKPEWWPESE